MVTLKAAPDAITATGGTPRMYTASSTSHGGMGDALNDGDADRDLEIENDRGDSVSDGDGEGVSRRDAVRVGRTITLGVADVETLTAESDLDAST